MGRYCQADSKMYMERQGGYKVGTRVDYTVTAQGHLGGAEAVLYHTVDRHMGLCIHQNAEDCPKSCDTSCGDGGAYSVDMFKSTELYTLNG